MDMALDQTRTREPAFGIVDLCLRSKSALDRNDAAVADANVQEFDRQAIRKARVADDEIYQLAELRSGGA
jgi:hypothetical protein